MVNLGSRVSCTKWSCRGLGGVAWQMDKFDCSSLALFLLPRCPGKASTPCFVLLQLLLSHRHHVVVVEKAVQTPRQVVRLQEAIESIRSYSKEASESESVKEKATSRCTIHTSCCTELESSASRSRQDRHDQTSGIQNIGSFHSDKAKDQNEQKNQLVQAIHGANNRKQGKIQGTQIKIVFVVFFDITCC